MLIKQVKNDIKNEEDITQSNLNSRSNSVDKTEFRSQSMYNKAATVVSPTRPRSTMSRLISGNAFRNMFSPKKKPTLQD